MLLDLFKMVNGCVFGFYKSGIFGESNIGAVLKLKNPHNLSVKPTNNKNLQYLLVFMLWRLGDRAMISNLLIFVLWPECWMCLIRLLKGVHVNYFFRDRAYQELKLELRHNLCFSLQVKYMLMENVMRKNWKDELKEVCPV